MSETPSDRLEPGTATTVEVPFDVLVNAVAALRINVTTALTVKPYLTDPYRDDRRWSPWTRWVDPAAHMAFDARRALTKSLPPDVARAINEAAGRIHAIPRMPASPGDDHA